jgi:uroporphyrinogen-III synthase
LHGIQYQPIWVYDQVPQLVTFPRFQGVLFFSPNQVDSFFQLQEVSSNIPAFCLGPTTHTQLKKFKHNTTITAQRATIESVMDELFKYFDTNDS